MGARIMIQSGISAGTIHWIERPVIRLGSAPSADVTVPSAALEPHALTIEYRQGAYRVYNRGTQQIFLGGQVLMPSQSGNWLDTDILELPDGVSLALDVDDDPAPSPAPALPLGTMSTMEPLHATGNSATGTERPSAQVEAAQAATESGRASRTTFQLTITAVCLMGCAVLIAREQLRQPAEPARRRPKFDTVIRSTLAPGSSVPRQVIADLQYAELAFVRDDRSAARTRYRRLYDTLLEHMGSQSARARVPTGQLETQNARANPTRSPYEPMVQLIVYRLSQLGDG